MRTDTVDSTIYETPEEKYASREEIKAIEAKKILVPSLQVLAPSCTAWRYYSQNIVCFPLISIDKFLVATMEGHLPVNI